MILQLVTAPASEPVTTAEAKSQARVDTSEDDTLIASRITAAREYVEAYTGRSLINTTWDWVLPGFPPSRVTLPRPPLSSITTIKYYAPSGSSLSTWDHATEAVVTTPYQQPGVVSLHPDYTWPATDTRENAVEIRFVAGYGATASSVPEVAKTAILLLVSHWYDERSPVIMGTISKELEFTLRALLRSMSYGGGI